MTHFGRFRLARVSLLLYVTCQSSSMRLSPKYLKYPRADLHFRSRTLFSLLRPHPRLPPWCSYFTVLSLFSLTRMHLLPIYTLASTLRAMSFGKAQPGPHEAESLIYLLLGDISTAQ